MPTPNSLPLCVFDGDPALAGKADQFIQATLAHPAAMKQTLDGIKITSNGELLYGVPSERDRDLDPELTVCIGAVIAVLSSGVDLDFRYDRQTRQALRQNPNLKDLWGQKRDAPSGSEEISAAKRLRIGRLAAFAGRAADPHNINSQLPAAYRDSKRLS